VHGADDDVVPIDLAHNLVGRHPWIHLDEVPGGHFELIEPGSPTWPAVVRALAD
jgi:pimeloyl-ACP methyl ester carboxylesterase